MIIIKIANPTKNDHENTGGGGQAATIASRSTRLVEQKPDGCRGQAFHSLISSSMCAAIKSFKASHLLQ